MVEYEIKYLITEDMYKELCELSPETKPKTQINYVFDTQDFFLLKNGITFRIRQKDNKYEMTAKIKIEITADSMKALELTTEIDEATAKAYIRNMPKEVLINILAKNGIMISLDEIKFLGKITTHRTRFAPYGFDVYFEVDKSEYLGVTDYELECEISTKEEKQMVIDYLHSKNIMPIAPLSGKYRRFVKRLTGV